MSFNIQHLSSLNDAVIFSFPSFKVIIDDIELGATYEFSCKRWLAKNEDDGLITRELYCGDKAGKGASKGELGKLILCTRLPPCTYASKANYLILQKVPWKKILIFPCSEEQV